MINDCTPISMPGLFGKSAQRDVILGYASCKLLHRLSFADVLDEDSGTGYQRRFNPQHSLDFRKYIQTELSSTIPLTFNLRPEHSDCWSIRKLANDLATVTIRGTAKVLAQVDCQHRIGYLNDLDIELPFMFYLGLSINEELEVFNIINGKAKGLSPSLLDFHDATLASDLSAERPELFIALYLNNSQDSPWYRQLDLGGLSTSGLMRRASLRTMQKAVKRFLSQSQILQLQSVEIAARVAADFWSAVAFLLRSQWENPRKYLVTKGVGVYALMGMAGDLFHESNGQSVDRRYFERKLSEFITEIDWGSEGDLSGLGGEAGVKAALDILRRSRSKQGLRLVKNG
jgi:DNA sulfur modification protein DndB